MAANNVLVSATVFPANAHVAAVGTTYQRFNLPEGGCNCIVVAASADIYVAWPDSGADDADTPSASGNYEPVPANAGPSYFLSENRAAIRAGFVLVAAQSGTAAVTVIAQRRDV